MVCASCGRHNDADASFCGGCGARLAAAPMVAETRKVVTVVFTDVAGSTALGERLDPESLRRVMWRYFDAMQPILERHGGTVEKFIGDAIVAVFGVPSVHEDDALRAVRAAGEMREALELVNESLAEEYDVRIATRTGVNTGEVIVGETTSDQKLATGDAVNVAARLEQAAQAGEVLLGESTYDLVRDAVVAEPAPAVEAKGKSLPLAAWRLVGLQPDVPAFTRPIRTPFVGRGRELAELSEAYDAVVRESSCRLATIVGPPGIGKSRLAREALGSFREAQPVVGRCAAYGEGVTYLPLADIVRQIAGAEPEPVLTKLLGGIERGSVATRLIMGALGANDEPGSPEETAWAFRRLFEALASSGPLVVVVDDIHWADETLLDLLEYLVGFSSGAPILLLCLARPDVFDVRPSWGSPRTGTTLVSLSPLRNDESEGLIEGLLGDDEVTPALRDRIVDVAGGNPLFVEQMLAMLADDPEAADEAVPATLQALLAARIDRLEPDERVVLQRASVEGRLFHRGAVAELLSPRSADGLGGILLTLARKELVRPDRSLFEGDDGFRFNHVLIRDVAYASMPKELRADLHARLAAWLEARAGAHLTGHEEIVGYHLEQAYLAHAELGRVTADASAAALKGGRLLGHAGRRALDRGEPRTAASLLERACRLLVAEPLERAALLTELGGAFRGTGELDAADSALTEAVEEARRHRDAPTELRAEMGRARVVFMRTRPEPDSLREIALRAIALFEPMCSDVDLADAWMIMGLAELAAQRPGSATRGSAAWPRARARFRRPAAADRVLERGWWRNALRTHTGDRGTRLPRRGACLGTGAWARRRGGRRTTWRPVPVLAARSLRRGARPPRALEVDLPRARHRVRACGGAHGRRRDGDARRGRRRRRTRAAATPSGSQRTWVRPGMSRSTARFSPMSCSTRAAQRRQPPSWSRQGRPTGTPRHGWRPRHGSSLVAARRRRRSLWPAKQLPSSPTATTSPRTPRRSRTSQRYSAPTATKRAPQLHLQRRSPSTSRRETCCPQAACSSSDAEVSSRDAGAAPSRARRGSSGCSPSRPRPTPSGPSRGRRASA